MELQQNSPKTSTWRDLERAKVRCETTRRMHKTSRSEEEEKMHRWCLAFRHPGTEVSRSLSRGEWVELCIVNQDLPQSATTGQTVTLVGRASGAARP